MDLELQDNKAVLSENLVKLLGAKPKDRIKVEYSHRNDQITPIIIKSDAGNLLSQSNTFICKGQEKDFLAQFGTKFEVLEEDGNLFLIGNQDYVVFTDVKAAVKQVGNYLDISICTDTNYDIKKYDSYTL